MNAMCETLETRSLMSATMGPTETITANNEPAAIGLLLPAVQKVREAAARMSSTAASSTDAGRSGHSGGVNVLLMDGSVRMGDGSVRFISSGVSATTW